MMKILFSETGFFFMNQMMKTEFLRARGYSCLYFLIFLTIDALGQGSGCVNGPTLTLNGTGENACG